VVVVSPAGVPRVDGSRSCHTTLEADGVGFVVVGREGACEVLDSCKTYETAVLENPGDLNFQDPVQREENVSSLTEG
jgi:hypothetical protein